MGVDQGRYEKLRVVKAELVAEIEFAEWTPDGHLRHSKFVGLREGKSTPDVLPAGLKPE
jgi:bifunctional non-homologous end joining protein LigD